MTDLIEIGFTRKPHGKDGYLRLMVNEAYLDILQEARAVFINLDGSKVPFLVEDLNISGSSVLIKLDELDDPQQAGELTGKTIYLENYLAGNIVKNQVITVWNEIIGYDILNDIGHVLGVISNIIEMPHQTMAEITNDGKSFLIPLHKDLVIELNEEEQFLIMELPEGIDTVN